MLISWSLMNTHTQTQGSWLYPGPIFSISQGLGPLAQGHWILLIIKQYWSKWDITQHHTHLAGGVGQGRYSSRWCDQLINDNIFLHQNCISNTLWVFENIKSNKKAWNLQHKWFLDSECKSNFVRVAPLLLLAACVKIFYYVNPFSFLVRQNMYVLKIISLVFHWSFSSICKIFYILDFTWIQ